MKLKFVSSLLNAFTSLSKRSFSSHSCLRKSSSENSHLALYMPRFMVWLFNRLYLFLLFTLLAIIIIIIKVVTILYVIIKSMLSLISIFILLPISIPFLVYDCMRKSLGIESRFKIWFSILDEDYEFDI